jgi:dynein heavy chain 1
MHANSSYHPVLPQVERSVALLNSLGNEKQRWEAGSETFKQQMSTIIGDVLLSAAFMAYAGYFDQQMRQSLFSNWCSHLQQAAIQFRHDLARTEVSQDSRLNLKYLNWARQRVLFKKKEGGLTLKTCSG